VQPHSKKEITTASIMVMEREQKTTGPPLSLHPPICQLTRALSLPVP